jgi:uncharacterized membrane protein
METHFRSILKAVSWRIGGTFVTFGIAWMLLGRLDLAAKIGAIDTAVKIGAFYGHERLWERVKLGKTKPLEYEI